MQTSLCQTQQTLAHLATHDPLTGILNRRAILEQLSKELSRAQRSCQPGQGVELSMPGAAVIRPGSICLANCGMGFLDIDHFKQINDQYGHQAGDEVLKGLVGILASQLRPYDNFGAPGR